MYEPGPADTCAVDRDCGEGWLCVMGPNGARSCQQSGCGGIGRPFLVAGAPRLPSIGTRSDWASCDAAPDVRALDAARRAGLAAAWTEAARMEHASIAAFARFTLELLAFGAPASLVEQAQAATADETRHAQLCFALASAYAGRAIGPGPLSMTGVGVASSVAGSAFNAFVEGCIGETVAAAEAVEAASLATDPAIAAVLRAIAEDEARHAALAWCFVSWALGGMPGADRARAVSELATAVEAALAAPLPGTAAELDLAPHGILGSDRRAALRREVITTVVRPCLLALAGSRLQPGGADTGGSLAAHGRAASSCAAS
jgi:hypothetical protein